MKPIYSFLLALGLICSPATAEMVPGCDFDGDGAIEATLLERNRAIRVGAFSIRLDFRAEAAACRDADGDGKSELLLTKGLRTNSISLALSFGRALGGPCKAVRRLNRGEIWKGSASKHINDARRFSTSFITLRGTAAPRNPCLKAYDGKGKLVHQLGRYFPTGAAYSSRYYGGSGCGDRKSPGTVAAIARRNTGSNSVYITSGTGNCALVPNPGGCYNSSAC